MVIGDQKEVEKEIEEKVQSDWICGGIILFLASTTMKLLRLQAYISSNSSVFLSLTRCISSWAKSQSAGGIVLNQTAFVFL